MKKIYALALLACASLAAPAQTVITASDMPVAGDTLRWSADLSALASISTGSAGTAQVWNYSSLTASAQGLDEYKTAAQVNLSYALTISLNAYGYKLGDSIPGIGSQLPVQVSDVYSFFEKKNNPSRFIASAFAANISGLPVPSNYDDDDEIYYFPLSYSNTNTSTYAVTIGYSGIGSVTLNGTRTTTVDGWGTIQTPYYSTPVSALRVRSETTEIDSVDFGGQTFGLPRQTVEYKWLTNDSHYPALWITSNVLLGTETPSGVRYRDNYRALAVSNASAPKAALGLYPNPAAGSDITLNVPASWQNYAVEVYDATGSMVLRQTGSSRIATSQLSPGSYLVRVWSGSQVGFAKFVK